MCALFSFKPFKTTDEFSLLEHRGMAEDEVPALRKHVVYNFTLYLVQSVLGQGVLVSLICSRPIALPMMNTTPADVVARCAPLTSNRVDQVLCKLSAKRTAHNE